MTTGGREGAIDVDKSGKQPTRMRVGAPMYAGQGKWTWHNGMAQEGITRSLDSSNHYTKGG